MTARQAPRATQSRRKNQRLIRLLADPYSGRSVGAHARRRRWSEIASRFPDLADMRILDLGGQTDFWTTAPLRPAHVTIVDPLPEHLHDPTPWMDVIEGDACAPDLGLTGFDLVHSNSTIEHVGGAHRRRQFAANVELAAPRHWIQTPYRYFPVEPHYLFPLHQFLPLAARAEIGRLWPLAQATRGGPVAAALDIELLSITEMRHLFPGSAIWSERVAGLVKSIVAVR